MIDWLQLSQQENGLEFILKTPKEVKNILFFLIGIVQMVVLFRAVF
nr:hypothetical protein [Borreliella burgdorferi]